MPRAYNVHTQARSCK